MRTIGGEEQGRPTLTYKEEQVVRQWHKRTWLYLGLSILIMLLTAACRNNGTPTVLEEPPPTLEQIRDYAQQAFNETLSSDERQIVREKTIRSLVKLLGTPGSKQITKEQWEKPLNAGANLFIRVIDLGKTCVYTLDLPGPGVVPPGQRVVVQVSSPSGTTYASELSVIQGGHVVDVRAFEESGHTHIILAASLARGGGYVAHYQRATGAGEFQLDPSVFKGLPTGIADLTLNVRENVLMVMSSMPQAWRPHFETKLPVRLYFDSDFGIEWKGRFILVDERSNSAFKMFHTALDPKAEKADRDAAWEKAVRKLPAYLEEPDSWSANILSELPPGATTAQDQFVNLAVRIVSVPYPAPEPSRSFTVIQHRSRDGLPMAQGITLPGVVETFRIINHQGLPGLIILSNGSARQSKVVVPQKKIVTLLRLTAGNDWEAAPDWFGFLLPPKEGWNMYRAPGSPHLEIIGEALDTNPQAVKLSAGNNATVQFCNATGSCVSLDWLDNLLGGAPWLAGKLREIMNPGAGRMASSEILSVAHAVERMVLSPEVQGLSAVELASILGKNNGVDVQGFDVSERARLIAMPSNPTGVVPLILSWPGGAMIEVPAPYVVDRWVGARELEAGGQRWLLALGQATDSAALVLYRWGNGVWVGANALNEHFDRLIAEQVRVSYVPGDATTIRGIYARGIGGVNVRFASDGKSVLFCEGEKACLAYLFDNGWQLVAQQVGP